MSKLLRVSVYILCAALAPTWAWAQSQATTGEVPRFRFSTGAPHPWARMDYAARLFLVSSDLPPLVVP